ncbi:polysaccharide lyase [Psychrobium sp. 1_MG-2023]|uniref:polysaccharide lyase n=1 Tax=Psychrobium sp. 1_MG-2023 TaxID=3062624 RepID=UPI000C349927|nr:hypothetical protein [Psychrobium sp. 1_MG-2023]MDP2560343.1 hypothetical protein [Psychrobium sp. 1_MG-2023]PKF55454.1 hypothetical protein CW748_13235 [Alteromonadales bacterium alter-6D02]
MRLLLLSLLFLSHSLIAQVYWSQGSHQLKDGATKTYADRSAKIPWRKPFGDFLDKNGTPYGNTPFSSTVIKDIDRSRVERIDILPLLKYWARHENSYHGIYLKGILGGEASFYSSEHQNKKPYIEITTNSQRLKFAITRDTSFHPSTNKSLGHFDVFSVSGSAASLLAIDPSFQALSLKNISRAQLVLTTTNKQHRAITLGTFAVAAIDNKQQTKLGIAKNFPQDLKITSHQAVIFSEDFSAKTSLFNRYKTPRWRKFLTQIPDYSQYQLVGTPINKSKFTPLLTQALELTFTPKGSLALGGMYKFKQLLGYEPEQMYFRYYLRLGDKWQPRDGGKLPGFAGTYNKGGWGGRKSNGFNGWSTRGAYGLPASANSSFSGATPIGNYVYQAKSDGNYGYVDFWHGTAPKLERNKWYCIEQFVKLNTVGKADGVIRAWVNGVEAFNKTDYEFRKTQQLKIESVWMNFYHGGTTKPNKTYRVYIDNIVIAHDYIGPMVIGR